MKKRINLFSQRRENISVLKYSIYGKRLTYGILVFGSLVLVALGIYYATLIREKKTVESENSTVSRYILANTVFSKEIEKYFFRYNLLKKFLSTDIDNFTLYQKLQKVLFKSGISAKIDSFSADEKGNLTFTLSIPTYDEAIQVVENIERPPVLKEFASLKLAEFDISQKNQDHKITFIAKLESL